MDSIAKRYLNLWFHFYDNLEKAKLCRRRRDKWLPEGRRFDYRGMAWEILGVWFCFSEWWNCFVSWVWWYMVGRIMAQKVSTLNLWIYESYGWKEICKLNWLLIRWPYNGDIIPFYLAGLTVTRWALKSGRGRQRSQWERHATEEEAEEIWSARGNQPTPGS